MKDDITISPYSNSPSTCSVERTDYGNVTIYKTSVELVDDNVYLLVNSYEPGNSLLIDAIIDAKHPIRLVEHVGAQVCTTVTTRSYDDHIQALGEFLQAFPARHIISGLDAADIPKPADQQLNGDETTTFGQDITPLTLILRGHVEDGPCLNLSVRATGTLSGDTPPHHLFVGGSIFPGGVSRTYSPEDFSQLIDDIEGRVLHVHPVGSVIHPDHGKDTIVGVRSPEVES